MVAQSEIPLEAVREVCRRHRVAELSIFGSAVRDDLRPESDIDLLVLFEAEARAGLLELIGLQEELTTLLGRRVDLVPKRGLKTIIRDDVLNSARLLYAA